jgi:hypothetical protein
MSLPDAFRTPVLLAPLLIGAATLAGCRSEPPRAASRGPIPAPPAAPSAVVPSAPTTPATTTDRGDRLQAPRPVGALAPEELPEAR